MTQRARKGKLDQLQVLIDLSCFIISHILVDGPPPLRYQQNSYTSITTSAADMNVLAHCGSHFDKLSATPAGYLLSSL